ncbi:hypothetical protein FLM48_11025 [Shewanella sp. Scap07]|uniref:hypothetical protein n=1 Tax=Shewanella sp. Scap07 TaxID=2589987 RepID=UPI0015BEB764|nr:hypothetical protein [Shewanella sp. Scap07]QLE85562.1 hypothetical protein FLM48_11025 [Shewanella sp. Scap07]
MGWLSSLFSFLTNPIADLTGGYRERKKVAAEMAADIARAKGNLKIAQFNAKADRARRSENNDADYDQTVLNNRRDTYIDEFIIIVFVGLFLAHFVPELQPYMANGWLAMGYDGAPWYFEFVIVGICVSTLGLMRLFRAFWQVKQGSKPRGNNETQ